MQHEVETSTGPNLWYLGPDARPAVPALVEAMKENDAKDETGHEQPPRLRVSIAAADSLCRIGPYAKEAIPALLELVSSGEDIILQCVALNALGSIGDQDARVVPTLLGALKVPRLRGAAAEGLGRLGPRRAKEIVPALLKALDAGDVGNKEDTDLVQFFIINSLGKMGPEAKVAVPRLEAILKAPKTRFQAHMAAEKALVELRR